MRHRLGIPAHLTRVVAVAAIVLHAGPAAPQPEIDPALPTLLRSAQGGQAIQAIVTLDRSPTAADLQAIQVAGIQVRPFSALPMVAVRGTALQIEQLAALPGARSIYLNRQLSYFLDHSVPLIGADRAENELGVTGRGVTVAVIDFGIDATHRDLPFGSKVIQNVKIAPDRFGTGPLVVEGLSSTDTTSGHGTHVAGIAGGTGAALGGKYRGVATGSQLVGIGAGEAMFILAGLEGFDWVLQNRFKYGIRVISNSWGRSGQYSPDDPVNVASRMAHDAGLVVVFAAGNNGPAPDTLNPYCVAPWVICVAAGNNDGISLWGFTSRGVAGDPVLHPTITAPGVDIASARATTAIDILSFPVSNQEDLGTDAVFYMVGTGTSMAAPHVSGTVALMLEANPALTPDQVKFVLESTATPMPGYLPHEVGAGYLNAFEAVRAVRQP